MPRAAGRGLSCEGRGGAFRVHRPWPLAGPRAPEARCQLVVRMWMPGQPPQAQRGPDRVPVPYPAPPGPRRGRSHTKPERRPRPSLTIPFLSTPPANPLGSTHVLAEVGHHHPWPGSQRRCPAWSGASTPACSWDLRCTQSHPPEVRPPEREPRSLPSEPHLPGSRTLWQVPSLPVSRPRSPARTESSR